MIVRTVSVTPFSQNARVVADEKSETAIIIDPGGEVPKILSQIPFKSSGESKDRFKVTGVVLTHAHIDHAGGVRRLLKELEAAQGASVPLYAHPLEKSMRASIGQQAVMFGLRPSDYESCPEPDIMIDEGDTIHCGENVFQVLFTPGHSPGHVSLYHAGEKPFVIAGDALFAGSIGRTDLPGGNHETLIRSIKEKLLTLPGNTAVLSGHTDDTTIEVERRTNPFLR